MQNKQLCCIEQCLSNSLRIKNISFHSMPKDKLSFDIWCKTIRRNVANFMPKPEMKICSIHFHRSVFKPDGDLKPTATPMYFPVLHDVRCCVQGCSSRQTTNSVFQKFPKDDNLCAKWVAAIEKHNGHPIKRNAMYVCSMHFANDTNANAVPTIFPPKPSYCIPIRTFTVEQRPVSATTTTTTRTTTTNADKPSDAKKMRPVDEIIILDDDDDDNDDDNCTSATPTLSTSNNNKNGQTPVDDKTELKNLPIRMLQRIQQKKNENTKAQREVNVLKRKYLELKKRCDAMSESH